MFTTSQKEHGARVAAKSSVCMVALMLGLWGCEVADIWKDANDFKKSPTPGITLSVTAPSAGAVTFAADGTTEVGLKVQILTADIDKDKRTMKVTADRGSFVVGSELKKSVDIQLDNKKETNLVYRVPREGAGARVEVSTAEGLLVSKQDFKFTTSCPEFIEIETEKTKLAETETLAIKAVLFRKAGGGLVSTGLRPEFRLRDSTDRLLTNANFAGISGSDSNGIAGARLILEKYAPGKYVIEINMEKAGCANVITNNRKTIEVLPPKEEEKK